MDKGILWLPHDGHKRTSMFESSQESIPGGVQGRPCGTADLKWGKNSCPGIPGTRMVYNGRVGGSYFNHNGEGVNCLT